MLDSLKKWLGSGAAPRRGWDALAPWAQGRQYVFRGVRKSEGFVIDGRCGALPWRLEWGASQRAYVSGFELRLRAELGVAGDMQVLVLNRVLQEAMERSVFDQYVEGVQTRIDTATPPEMRWLVMFPKLAGADLRAVRERCAAVTNHKPWLTRWLEGPLPEQLAAAPGTPADPLVLMIGRGRLILRTSLVEPDVELLERWITVFETAMSEARRVATEAGDGSAPSTQPSLWAASAMPGEGASAAA
jgi:hypothetical protein